MDFMVIVLCLLVWKKILTLLGLDLLYVGREEIKEIKTMVEFFKLIGRDSAEIRVQRKREYSS